MATYPPNWIIEAKFDIWR